MTTEEFVNHLRQTGSGSLTCRNVVGNLWTRRYTFDGEKFYAHTEAHGLGLLAGAAAEREACARLVQDFKTDSPPGTICHWGEALARIIRKRGNA